jgi:hypothetical protein
MSRDGSNIYSAPAGTLAVSGTTIESAKYNAFVNDLVADANLPRPIVAGGTGTSTAGGWLAAMGVTATAAELNTLDGITATVAELNVLDGIPGTLTATEIGYLDGVTSAIQTQLNAKQATITTLPLANGGTGAALVDPGADRILFWDDSAGAMAFLEPGPGLIVSGTTLTSAIQWQTAVATTSGDDLSLSAAIPATASRLVVSFRGVSINGTNDILVQLGTSGGFVITGYVSSCGLAGPSTSGGLSTAGILVFSGSAGRTISGSVTLDKVSGNLWSATVCCSDGIENIIAGGGYVDLGGVATQIRISTSGANTFDAGAASVGWQ